MSSRQMSKQWRYVRGLTVPRTIPPGRVLAHNHIQHTSNTVCGVNGFRAWTWPKENVPRNFVKCPCGWSGLPHVALRKVAPRLIER
jgi:hypothetical protein